MPFGRIHIYGDTRVFEADQDMMMAIYTTWLLKITFVKINFKKMIASCFNFMYQSHFC